MVRWFGLLLALLLAACATSPVLTPWQADALLAALPADCTGSTATTPAAGGSGGVPGGLSVVRSEGRDVILVAARTCLWTVDAATGAAAALPTRGDSIAPNMVDGRSDGLAFSSSLSGSVRVIDAEGAVTFHVSGLRRPLGVRRMPGGTALVAEHDAGRILRLGPSQESRARLVVDELDGPVGIVIADATQGYVTENRAGRVTRFRLDAFEKSTVARGLKNPQGITLMPDGRLAVAEVGRRRLIAIDPRSGVIEVMADNLPLEPAPAGDAADPHAVTDVAAAPDGTLYLTSGFGRTVLKVTRRAASPPS
jgi:sugar lactone lactonase YvrE